MYFDRIEVENVRNIPQTSLDLGRNLNLIEGPNGAGKTAILEALHLLIRGRSFRSRTQAIIRHGEQLLLVRAILGGGAVKNSHLGFQKSKSGKSEMRLDGSVVKRLSSVASMIPLQVFLPNLSDVVFGAPSLRRKWLDWGVFHVKHEYLDIHRGYIKALRQRNAALKQKSDSLKAWTSALVAHGESLTDYRNTYLERVGEAITDCLCTLAPEINVSLSLDCGWQGESFAKELRQQEPRDMLMGSTQKGPHRADISIRVEISNSKFVENKSSVADDRMGLRLASNILSRGQGKALASALYFGQAQEIASATGKKSVFLIDDAGSELDKDYNKAFFHLLSEVGVQAIATTTTKQPISDISGAVNARMFHVKHGKFCQLT
jgi:DNA replication and repair protein RecF